VAQRLVFGGQVAQLSLEQVQAFIERVRIGGGLGVGQPEAQAGDGQEAGAAASATGRAMAVGAMWFGSGFRSARWAVRERCIHGDFE